MLSKPNSDLKISSSSVNPDLTLKDVYDFYNVDGITGKVRRDNLHTFPVFATKMSEERKLLQSIQSQIDAIQNGTQTHIFLT